MSEERVFYPGNLRNLRNTKITKNGNLSGMHNDEKKCNDNVS